MSYESIRCVCPKFTIWNRSNIIVPIYVVMKGFFFSEKICYSLVCFFFYLAIAKLSNWWFNQISILDQAYFWSFCKTINKVFNWNLKSEMGVSYNTCRLHRNIFWKVYSHVYSPVEWDLFFLGRLNTQWKTSLKIEKL